MKRFSTALGLFSILATAACGSLPDDEGEPSTLVKLQGTVQSTNGELADKDVRVAMIWASGDDHVLAVDTDVQAEFPATFSLPVKHVPPAGFIAPFDGDPSGPRAAIARVVAYKDLNKNGKLDMLSFEATEPIDKIVGTERVHLVAYLQDAATAARAEMEDMNGNHPNAGFNLMKFGVSSSVFEWVPLSTQLTLVEDTSDEAQQAVCLSFSGSGSGGPAVQAPPGSIGPDGKYPAPDDPQLYCDATSPDEYRYSVETLTVNRPCYQEFESTLTAYSKPAGSSPPGWPCSQN